MSDTVAINFIAGLIFVSLLGATSASADTLLIHQARLISGDHPVVSAPSDVLINDGRILAIGSGLGPADREIDAHGHYLIPGLIDAHVHLEGVPGYRGTDPDDQSMLQEALDQIPRSYLYFGFTALLDLAGKGSFIEKWNNRPVTPRAYYCAPLLIPNGYPLSFLEDHNQQFKAEPGTYLLFDPNQPDVYPPDFQREQHMPKRLIEQAKNDGASCIKVFYETGFGAKKNLPVPSLELIQDIVREAHKLKLPVYMHGNSQDSYELALKAGVDTLAHGMWHESDAGQHESNLVRENRIAKELVAANIAVQPTMQVLYGEQEIFNPDFFNNPLLRQAVPERLISWYKSKPGQWMKNTLASEFDFATIDTAAQYQAVQKSYQHPLATVRHMTNQLYLQGDHLQFGSDSPSGPFYTQFPGMNGRLEMDRWIEAGISPSDLFSAMTVVNARAIGVSASIGSIEVGLRADLLLLADNPLDSVHAYDTIELVILNGHVHDRASLSAQPSSALAKAVTAADQPAFGLLSDTTCTSANKPVDEKGFVRIGGIEQWVRIKGSSCAKPIIVMVHGGPGNPNTPFADNLFKAWEKDFTIVQWDQRGAGMTYGRNPGTDDKPLVLERLRDDGIEVARYVAKRFGKQKVILMGGSWGSVLGVYMAKSNPEMYCAYISSSQVVNRSGERASYDATLALARATNDADSVAMLESLGPPPWANPRNLGMLRRVTRKYEGLRTEPAPKAWWIYPPEYTTAKAEADYTAGEDYSWLQFVGMKGDGIDSKIDLYKLGPKFDVPFYMVQGQEDLWTMPEPSKHYFDFIQAPRKEFVLVPRAGHDPNQPMVDAQYSLLKERIGDCR